MNKLGVISDEICDDFEKACFISKMYNLQYIELRTINKINLLELNINDYLIVKKTINKYKLKISGIASPVFKSSRKGNDLTDYEDYKLKGYKSFKEQISLYQKAVDISNYFNTNTIRIFTFLDENNYIEIIDDIADKIIEISKYSKNTKIAIENESSCNVKNALQANYLLSLIKIKTNNNIKNIGLIWDPGNAYHSTNEKPYPEANDLLNPKDIIHVHLKDVKKINKMINFVPIGSGDIDYVKHIKQLKKYGYNGIYILEPHYLEKGINKEDSTKTCIDSAKNLFEKIR